MSVVESLSALKFNLAEAKRVDSVIQPVVCDSARFN
jgi:hypothetical protein